MHRRHRFSLVELLIVIAILAILMAMLLPALARARQTATLVACTNNTRQMGVATMLYLSDNKNAMPRGAEGYDYSSSFGGNSMGIPFIRFGQYLGLNPPA